VLFLLCLYFWAFFLLLLDHGCPSHLTPLAATWLHLRRICILLPITEPPGFLEYPAFHGRALLLMHPEKSGGSSHVQRCFQVLFHAFRFQRCWDHLEPSNDTSLSHRQLLRNCIRLQRNLPCIYWRRECLLLLQRWIRLAHVRSSVWLLRECHFRIRRRKHHTVFVLQQAHSYP
jgi:hypothetical protein